jgi:hypothetical protein
LISFKFKVDLFTIQDATFKSLDKDSIFNKFKQVYPRDAYLSFLATKDGLLYGPSDFDGLTIEEKTFTLPVGESTVSGD